MWKTGGPGIVMSYTQMAREASLFENLGGKGCGVGEQRPERQVGGLVGLGQLFAMGCRAIHKVYRLAKDTICPGAEKIALICLA